MEVEKLDLWYSGWVLLSVNSQKKGKRKKNCKGAEAPSQRRRRRGARGGFLCSPAPIDGRARERGSAFGRRRTDEAPTAPLQIRATRKKREKEWLSEREIEHKGRGTGGSNQTPVRAQVGGEVPVGSSPATSEARANPGSRDQVSSFGSSNSTTKSDPRMGP